MTRDRMALGFLVASLACTAIAAGADDALFDHSNYHDARDAAQERDAPLFVLFTAPGCVWCRALERDSLTDPSVVRLLRGYVCVKVDVEAEPRTAFEFRIGSVPRMLVINTFGEIVGDRVGFLDADGLAAFLREVRPNVRIETGATPAPAVDPGPAEAASIPAADYGDDRVAALADPDPAVREAARNALVEQGRAAVPALIRALSSDYLGARIGAWETLQALGAADHPFDPWASREERARSLEPWQARRAELLAADFTEEDLNTAVDRIRALHAARSDATLLLEGDWNNDDRIDAWVYDGGDGITLTETDEDRDGAPDKVSASYPLDPSRVLRMILRSDADGLQIESHRIEAAPAP